VRLADKSMITPEEWEKRRQPHVEALEKATEASATARRKEATALDNLAGSAVGGLAPQPGQAPQAQQPQAPQAQAKAQWAPGAVKNFDEFRKVVVEGLVTVPLGETPEKMDEALRKVKWNYERLSKDWPGQPPFPYEELSEALRVRRYARDGDELTLDAWKERTTPFQDILWSWLYPEELGRSGGQSPGQGP
jgi:cytochrome c5